MFVMSGGERKQKYWTIRDRLFRIEHHVVACECGNSFSCKSLRGSICGSLLTTQRRFETDALPFRCLLFIYFENCCWFVSGFFLGEYFSSAVYARAPNNLDQRIHFPSIYGHWLFSRFGQARAWLCQRFFFSFFFLSPIVLFSTVCLFVKSFRFLAFLESVNFRLGKFPYELIRNYNGSW